jgi:hypothetical protein
MLHYRTKHPIRNRGWVALASRQCFGPEHGQDARATREQDARATRRNRGATLVGLLRQGVLIGLTALSVAGCGTTGALLPGGSGALQFGSKLDDEAFERAVADDSFPTAAQAGIGTAKVGIVR